MPGIRQRIQGRAGLTTSARRSLGLFVVSGWCVMLAASMAAAEDWPTYQHDVARTGVTAEPVRPPLVECWKFQSRYAPRPAWGDPKPVPIEGIPELRRRHFDDVYQVVVAGGAAYFGSSADHKVYCLDLSHGKIRWAFPTGGPVRLAPAIVGGRAYFGSDDGWVYCLNATDGRVAWRFHAAPTDERVLGHGKMISLWPVRTGVLVDAGVAYFAAGIFPAEGVFFYAVDANDGKLIWRNDSCGEAPQSGVSPQGYLLASATTLYAPMGRVSPGAFDRRDGKLKFQSYFGKDFGGTYAMLVEGDVYTGTEKLVGYREGTQRDRFAVFAGRKLIVHGPHAYLATGDRLLALDRVAYPKASARCDALRGQIADLKARSAGGSNQDRLEQLKKELEAAERDLAATIPWQTPCEASEALILAGNVLYAGGAGQVLAIDADSGKQLWKSPVEGSAKGLAAAAGRLLASTDKGTIYCFGPPGTPAAGTIVQANEEQPASLASPSESFADAAEAILKQTGVRRGYCLVLGCKTGQLAIELARRSELMIYTTTPDAADADAARKAVDAAGLSGARVCVDYCAQPRLPYSDYFANLVVAESGGIGGVPPDEVFRVLKPQGGVAMLRQPSGLPDGALAGANVVRKDDRWLVLQRGPLPGAGSWTHQYAEPGNTACGDDELVRGPLGLLWFGNPGPGQMVNRHERAASPLSIDGRLFIQGENVLMAYDAYNGLKLWEREIAGAMRVNASHDGSNLALSRQRLFVALREACLGLDPATGETKITYAPPPSPDSKPRRLGCILHADQMLYGSQGTRPTVSDRVLAWDVESGKLRWVYEGRSIGNNTIAYNEGRLVLIDSDMPAAERKAALASLPEAERPGADLRMVVALDAKTGHVLWKKPMNLAFCGGSNLAVMATRRVLVIFGVYLDGHYWQQFFAGHFASRRVAVLDAADGKLLWSKAVGYRVRPVIIGDTLHAEPWAFDLATGNPRTRVHPVTGQTDRWQFARPGHHCGCPNAAPHSLFFRSWCLGYYDLVSDCGTMHFGAQRPGCWINMIPAAGLLLVPEASTGCMCAFPNMCTVAFQPKAKQKGWSYFSAPGPMTPVERLGINLGAPGDRRDASGKLWLGYPRPSGSLVLQFNLDTTFAPGGSFSSGNNAYTPISGTEEPWLFASAARGLTRCAIPLLGRGDGLAVYRVRLGFADPDQDQPGVRVFDVKLQGKTVLEKFDIAATAGGRDKAVFREFSGIEVSDKLLLELVPRNPSPKSDAELPILQAIEIVREKVLKVGCAASDLLISTMEPKQSAAVKLVNLRDAGFEGTVEASAPKGFAVSPNRVAVRLDAGARRDVPLEVSLVGDAPAGKYPLKIRLLRSDGQIETETSASIEHLGRRARIVVAAVEDAHVQRRYPELNRGSAGVLLVDGGNATMGDMDHAVAYLKFRFAVPGKVLSVRFRIRNAGNPSGDCGRLCLVTDSWAEKQITYARRPSLGAELARLGSAAEHQLVECPLKLDLQGRTELSLAIDPTSTDGVDFLSRESGSPPELIIDYEPEK
jgi:outer membrane protein assembly factor BamB